MAIPTYNSGLDLGLGLGLGNQLVSKSSSRATPRGVKQRKVAGTRQLSGLQIFHLSERCLAWNRNWGGSLYLKPTGSIGEAAVLGGSLPGLGLNVMTTGFDGENRSEKRFYSQHQSRIASSKSSSGSPGVEAAPDSLGKDVKQFYDDNGSLTKLENQSSLKESDTGSGGWESEQDHAEAEFAERNHSSQVASTRISEDSLGEQNGKLHGGVDDAQEEDSWAKERSTSSENSSSSSSSPTTAGTTAVGPKEPVYEVIEVSQLGRAVKKLVSRRQLLRTSGLRLRDLRRVDPSLWVTNSAPALLVRDQAILLNLGSLRAIATTQEVLIFDHKSKGARSFMEALVPRLNDHQNGSVAMPFELEVIESALISRTQRLERALMDVEPRVLRLLEVLPNCMTADVLEELRVSKQALVEIGSKAGALRQMLLELLEHPHDIRRMVIMGRICSLGKDGISVECTVPEDKQVAEDEEEEMEMLLEYYLQRCESTHGQAMKLLSSAKEMEDSIAVNLSSRRLEVSRLELLLQVGTFCAALGALVAGIFGMNLKSYLEERVLAFWFTTGGIIFGGIALFIYMFNYLSSRKIV